MLRLLRLLLWWRVRDWWNLGLLLLWLRLPENIGALLLLLWLTLAKERALRWCAEERSCRFRLVLHLTKKTARCSVCRAEQPATGIGAKKPSGIRTGGVRATEQPSPGRVRRGRGEQTATYGRRVRRRRDPDR